MPRYTGVWLDYLKAKNIKLDVKDVLVQLVTSDRNGGHHSLCIFFFAFQFFAVEMYIPWVKTAQLSPAPISLQ